MHRKRAVHVGSLGIHGSRIAAPALMPTIRESMMMYPEGHEAVLRTRLRALNGARSRTALRLVSSFGSDGEKCAMCTEARPYLRAVVTGEVFAGYQIQHQHRRTTGCCWTWTAAGTRGGLTVSLLSVLLVLWSLCRSSWLLWWSHGEGTPRTAPCRPHWFEDDDSTSLSFAHALPRPSASAEIRP